ncbi:MAG: type II toxin-antitoxin system VapC family toxin [bacterium]|nr:type II toxin-antitoxin system VapC family toxin [bacterium]
MAKKIVVDSSVIVKWVSSDKEEHLEQADKILRDAEAGKIELYAAELAKYEVGNALLKGKELPLSQVSISLGVFYALPITFLDETEQLARSSYEMARDSKMTYYDAAFLSVAKALGGLLITDNIKHQGKTSEVHVTALRNY